MRKLIFLLLIFGSSLCFAQKKDRLDITSNVEVRTLVLKPIGNNTLAKDFRPFFGVGIGGQLMTPIHFGVGLDYNILWSDVKYGHEAKFGNLGSQQLANVNLHLIHKDEIDEDFSIEEYAGVTFYRLTSLMYPGKEKYSEGRGGISFGAKGIYTLDNEGIQQFVFGINASTYSSGVTNENSEIQKYYRSSFFLNFNLGYRINF